MELPEYRGQYFITAFTKFSTFVLAYYKFWELLIFNGMKDIIYHIFYLHSLICVKMHICTANRKITFKGTSVRSYTNILIKLAMLYSLPIQIGKQSAILWRYSGNTWQMWDSKCTARMHSVIFAINNNGQLIFITPSSENISPEFASWREMLKMRANVMDFRYRS